MTKFLFSLGLAGALVACSGNGSQPPASELDASAPGKDASMADGALLPDGAVDAQVPVDAMVPEDATLPPLDAAPREDAAVGDAAQALDATTPVDAAAESDAAPPADAAVPVDGAASFDAAPPVDAAPPTDARTADAEVDAAQGTPSTLAFRFTDLDLRDPHAWVNFIGCRDLTDTTLAGFSINSLLQSSIQSDGDDADAFLDSSPTVVFPSFEQSAASQPVELHFAECTSPMATTSCAPGTGGVISATATYHQAGQCLSALPGTSRPYSPAIGGTSAPCFVTSPVTVPLDLGGIPVTLRDARIAATYSGSPASALTHGLLMGFISETDANNTLIPSAFPLIGGQPLSSLFPGGANNCNNGTDKDEHQGVAGWWVYLNFPASAVTWVDD